ncbi:YdcF family protein [Mycolicibacterium agri]|uniref:YdcF family protein n=1 Tax=Mycolicibacterium agri TaxID=36811 RepID=UPI001F33FCC0|nr:hypothetical protein [Mycolicibacterium agri]
MRRLGAALAAIAGVVLVAGLAGVPVYVHPQVDRPRQADAILILGGPDSSRYSYGLGLGAQGWAPNVVVSNPDGAEDPWLTRYCQTPQTRFKLYCFTPDPPTTKGEGQELRRLASKHNWRAVLVVTLRPHISRARFILERCFSGELTMVPIPERLSPAIWAFQYVYQTAGYARALLQPEC